MTLKVAGYSYAGHPYTTRVGFGECIRIMTGAMIPQGCDTVVQQENVKLLDETHLTIPPENRCLWRQHPSWPGKIWPPVRSP